MTKHKDKHANDHPPLSDPSTTPTDIVIRNLRRRVWKAVVNEDAATVIRLYQLTRRGWEALLKREQEQASRAAAAAAATTASRGNGLRQRWSSFRRKDKSARGLLVGAATTTTTTVTAVVTPVDSTLEQQQQQQQDDNQTPLLSQHFLPSEPFIEDDFQEPNSPYPPLSPDGRRAVVLRKQQATSSVERRARFALGALLGRRHAAVEPRDDSDHATPEDVGDTSQHLTTTTPLHEAARMGSGELVRLLLSHSMLTSDPDARDGKGRSALHCAAGGWTRREEQQQQQQQPAVPDMAIRVPHVTPTSSDTVSRGGSGVVGRLLRRASWTHHNNSNNNTPTESLSVVKKPVMVDVQTLELDRMDAALALLSWRSPDGQNISTNVVDDDGRTALHYAAEAGRAEFCQALLLRTETFLTLIDQQRKTPCDLAGSAGHVALAAHLEARALLYRDPYGMDDELLAQIVQSRSDDDDNEDNARTKLISPFSWFTTYNKNQINAERERRVREALELLQKVVTRRSQGEKALESLLGEPVKREDPDEETQNFSIMHAGHIEMLLNKHGWDVKKTAVAFSKSPRKAFEKCGVAVPSSKSGEDDGGENLNEGAEHTCLICCESFPMDSDEWRSLETCAHGFCKPCLGDYIANVARSRSYGLAVKCPHHECKAPLTPVEVGELAVDRQDYDRIVATSNSNLVVANDALRYCPHPNCQCVVKFSLPEFAKDAGLDAIEIFHRVGGVCATQGANSQDRFLSYEGVNDPQYFHHERQPKKAHRFCFDCGEAFAHWPLGCDKLDSWKGEVATHLREVEGEDVDDEDFNAIAQKLWMKANTRPCPKCQVPIEKDQGCNHMTCVNPACNYEFCWICRNDWKLHSTQTGGYFRCNRWQENQDQHEYYDKPPDPTEFQTPTDEDLSDPTRMRVIYGTAMHESRVAHKKSKEVGRFIHHYHRWSAHSQSRKLESDLSEKVCEGLGPVISAAKEFTEDPAFNFSGKGLSFLYAAFTELDECRSVLLHSYPYAYYRYTALELRQNRYRQRYRHLNKEKKQFEKVQSELELLTEQISDIVARKYLRANESQIQFLTVTAAEKRKEFTNCIIAALTEDQRETERTRQSAQPQGLSPSGTRITGVSLEDGAIFGEDEFEGDGVVEHFEDALQQSLEEFHLRMDAHDLSEVDSDGFGDQSSTFPPWSCPACTFMNQEPNVPLCEMCGSPHPNPQQHPDDDNDGEDDSITDDPY